MEIALVCSSLTGNTKKVAVHILKENEEIQYMSDIEDVEFERLNMFQTIILCYWNIKGTADMKTQTLIQKLHQKKIILIGPLGAYPDSAHALRMKERVKDLCEESGNEVIASFCCQGKIDPKRTEKRRLIPKGQPHYLDEEGYQRHLESRKPPDEHDLGMAALLVAPSIQKEKLA